MINDMIVGKLYRARPFAIQNLTHTVNWTDNRLTNDKLSNLLTDNSCILLDKKKVKWHPDSVNGVWMWKLKFLIGKTTVKFMTGAHKIDDDFFCDRMIPIEEWIKAYV